MTRHDLDILAGEYVLGTLDSESRARAEKLMVTDAAFQQNVHEWNQRLAPLSEAIEPVSPPSSAWAKIEAALASSVPASPQPLAELASQMAELKRSLAAWRFAAMTAVAASVALAFVWMGEFDTPFRQTQPEERYVAMLENDKGDMGFVITMNMNGRQFAIRPVSAQAPANKVYELWAIMKDSKKPPMTLGLVGTGAYAMMDAPLEIDSKELEKGVQLAVSLEGVGGAPAGAPMGPVMFAGLLVKLTP